MSRTGIDAATLARSLRGTAGDGSMEWVMEPIQARVLLDVADALDENAELRELVLDLYCLAFPSTMEWEVTDETYDKYSPCELCEKAHGGKSPCASTSRDMSDECCTPFQADVVADRMRELGIEVDE